MNNLLKTVFGNQGDDDVNMDEIAEMLGMITGMPGIDELDMMGSMGLPGMDKGPSGITMALMPTILKMLNSIPGVKAEVGMGNSDPEAMFDEKAEKAPEEVILFLETELNGAEAKISFLTNEMKRRLGQLKQANADKAELEHRLEIYIERLNEMSGQLQISRNNGSELSLANQRVGQANTTLNLENDELRAKNATLVDTLETIAAMLPETLTARNPLRSELAGMVENVKGVLTNVIPSEAADEAETNEATE